MIESDPTSQVNSPPFEEVHLDRRMPITMGQFAVNTRRTPVRNSFSDIIGLDETRKLVDTEEALLDSIPKATPRRGPAVRFH